MSDIKALIVQNELSLPEEKTKHLLALINSRSPGVSFLAPEKEAGPFLLYCCGDDLQTIATKTNFPIEIVLLTAIYYRWPEKAKNLQRDITSQNIGELQKDIAKSLLVATYISMQKQLGDVIAGRLNPEDAGLIPKSLQALEKLMTMVSDIMNPKTKDDKPAPTHSTRIQAQNVQVVQQSQPTAIEAPKEQTPAQIAKLKALEGV